MSFFKILPFIWPFVKELMLGNKTLAEAFKDNKKKVLMTLIIMLSFALNIFVIPKLITISGQHILLQREHDKLQASLKDQHNTSPIQGGKAIASLEDPPRRVAQEDEPQHPVSSDKTARTSKSDSAADRAAKMRQHFDDIRRQEEKEQ